MRLLKVAVHAPDHLSLTGLIHCLDHRPELVTMTWTEGGVAADVGLMTVERTMDITTFVRLRANNRAPLMPVVLIADRLADAEIKTVTRYGVVRILPRTTLDQDEMVTSIVLAATGERRGTALSSAPAVLATTAAEAVGTPLLLPRETDVLQLLADGFETPEIAAKLCYSERTVKNIISKVIHRLSLRSRTHAVAHAVRIGAI
jgi:DNA-binding NarL/FixJ family response regulator